MEFIVLDFGVSPFLHCERSLGQQIHPSCHFYFSYSKRYLLFLPILLPTSLHIYSLTTRTNRRCLLIDLAFPSHPHRQHPPAHHFKHTWHPPVCRAFMRGMAPVQMFNLSGESQANEFIVAIQNQRLRLASAKFIHCGIIRKEESNVSTSFDLNHMLLSVLCFHSTCIWENKES